MQGSHFPQEEAPEAVGRAAAGFVARVLAGQIAHTTHAMTSLTLFGNRLFL